MKRGLLLGIMACFVPAQSGAAKDEPTIALEDVERADAMAIADRLLPPEILSTVIEGTVRRVWVPGNVFVANYRTAPRRTGPDLCERTLYSVRMSGGQPPPGAVSGGTDLTIGSIEATQLEAVVFPAVRADAESCRLTEGYIALGPGMSPREPELRLAAYRRLVERMRAARGPGPLEFEILCKPTDDPPGTDPRAALDNLPLGALFRIDLDSARYEIISEEGRVSFRQRLPVEPARDYKVVFEFGPSDGDAMSWRVSWEEGTPEPAMLLERQAIIYH
ncbi:hypothetical protein AAJ72_14175 [Citromicrobium sp. RCC1885]|uniref:hypothetical protein n=1 Tax=unclassified Citromicrobium TaxID=2630544 RepID=UPI0006C91BD8|nr:MULTISPECIES: hypothetical protein [unclassified Citromicrobium]KPM21785.1 hypothetical protein AAJ72_14175 [Citromicrobium sp. RCC1885]KPM23584.1 hypothetical protein AAJ74_14450 [Citromicrobium sp. RCC1878]MAO03359.1 hypothetical protein [Citromicrobium sp.]OAM06794.1 hypothetical protein A0U43_14375 [Citromicrobium sp. RCC1897]|tara:strand:+ start:1942 stop:2772 length:831 start_codon:yes stop_codon:yes gene_type:complete